MYSIKTRLLVALSIVLALTTIATGAAMYYSVQREVDRLLDGIPAGNGPRGLF